MTAVACVCGHQREAHEHFRTGSDCGECGADVCARYRPVGGILGRLRAALERFGR